MKANGKTILRIISVVLTALMVASLFTITSITSSAYEIVAEGKAGDDTNVVWRVLSDKNGAELQFGGSGEIPVYYGPASQPWCSASFQYQIKTVSIIGKGIEKIPLGLMTGIGCYDTVNISESVKVIDTGAFVSGDITDSNLQTINFSDGSEELQINERAFYNNKKLKEINIPARVKTLNNAFGGCDNIKKITLNEGLETIKEKAFNSNKITELTIPKSVTVIEKDAVYNCNDLKEITFLNPDCKIELTKENLPEDCVIKGNNTSTAKEWAKKNGFKFRSLDNPDFKTTEASGKLSDSNCTYSIDTNGTLTISGNGEIPDVTDSSDVFKKATDILSQSENIKKIIIDKNVSKIGEDAFKSFDNLYEIEILSNDCEIYDNATTIPNTAVIYCDYKSTAKTYAEKYNKEAYSLNGYNFIPKSNCGWKITEGLYGVKSLVFEGEGAIPSYPAPGTQPWWADAIKNRISYIDIKPGITEILTTLTESKNLVSINIPNTVTYIGRNTLEASRIWEIDFEEGDEKNLEIQTGAFTACKELEKVTIPSRVKVLNDIFSSNEFGPTTSIKEFILNEGLETIKEKAFNSNKITELTIPKSVTTIEKDAVYNCNELKNITFLNPECNIELVKENLPEDCVIIGDENSTAQKWAEDNGFKFNIYGVEPTNATESEEVTTAPVTEENTQTTTQSETEATEPTTGITTEVPTTEATEPITQPATQEDTKAPVTGKPSLSKKSVTLKVGKSTTITVNNGEVLVWDVSDSKVVKVDNGKITALKAGTATVSAFLGNGEQLTCKVTVKAKASKKNTKVKLNTPVVKYKFTKDYEYVKLSWKKIKKATGYKIYKYANKKWKVIKTTTKKTYKARIKEFNKTYKFRVKAYKKVGKKTYYSKAFAVKAKKKLIN